jgi:hypothetical protein
MPHIGHPPHLRGARAKTWSPEEHRPPDQKGARLASTKRRALGTANEAIPKRRALGLNKKARAWYCK